MICRLRLSATAPLLALLGLSATLFSGCITHRTVSQNGRVISTGPAIKRPVRDTIRRSQ